MDNQKYEVRSVRIVQTFMMILIFALAATASYLEDQSAKTTMAQQRSIKP